MGIMTITRISSGPGLPSGFPFSLATEANGTLYISGMPSLGDDGKYAPGSFTQEADRAWANVVAIAAAAGYSPDEVTYVQVALADIGYYGDLNKWWRNQFPDPAVAPARFTYQAGALPFWAKVELQAVAAHGS
jgi:2-iminobutanoate/2-iminopropanoate deaminase